MKKIFQLVFITIIFSILQQVFRQIFLDGGEKENSWDSEGSDNLKLIGLSKRQVDLYNFIGLSSNCGMSDLSPNFSDVTERTLRRDLNELITKGLISKQGKTKSVTYKLL